MTVTYGLTDTGFVIKTLQVIRADLNAALQAAFGTSIDLGDRSIFGQIVGILAERYALLWELAEAVYSSQDPNKATGFSLDAVAALTGTSRPAATHSAVTETLFGVPGTVVPSGSLIKTASTGVEFQTSANATIASVPNWIASHGYVVGDRVFSDSNRIYQCIVAGISDPSTPVNGPGPGAITDGTAQWVLIQDFVNYTPGAIDVNMFAVDTGPVTAAALDLTVPVSGVTGWNGQTNLTAATPGRDLASDEELRILREEELAGDGETTADAIRAKLLKIVNMLSVTMFTNDTDTTNSDGMPPHSVEAVVRTSWSAGDPLDQQIFDTLYQNVAAGIVTTSSTGATTATGTSTDSQGVAHTVHFSRPTEVPIYSILNVTVDQKKFPTDGVTQIKNAIVAWGQAQESGKDAVATALIAQAFSVAGVLDVTSCYIGTAPSPASSATVSIDTRHLATYSTGNLVVNVSYGTP